MLTKGIFLGREIFSQHKDLREGDMIQAFESATTKNMDTLLDSEDSWSNNNRKAKLKQPFT